MASDGASTTSSGSHSQIPDVTAFAGMARRSLTDTLDKISGPKTVVLDAGLAGPLGLVAEMSLLRDHGVDRIFWLEPGALSQAQKHIVYICRPEIRLMRIIADQIKSAPAALSHTYTILLAPRVTSICASTLEDLGVLGSVELHEFPMALIPIERDVLSLELPAGGYRDIFLDSNYDAIYETARGLITLQRAFGLIPRIIGKGDASRRLVDIMFRLRSELPPSSSSISSSSSRSGGLSSYGQIDSLILLDRQVDMVTPLCTQLTYEGLIDEVIGIKNSYVEVDPAITNPVPPTPSSSTAPHFGAASGPPKKKKHLLSTLGNASSSSSSNISAQNAAQQQQPAGDPLFGEIRDKNFAVIGEFLHQIAKRINTDYEERHKAQTVGQIRDFVGRLGGLQAEHQALRLHTALSEQILQTTKGDDFNRALEAQQNLVAGLDVSLQENVVRDLINQESSVNSVLRLLCLCSLITGGLKPKVLEEMKRDILQTYGYEYLPLLVSLADLSLIAKSPSSTKSAFATARKPLRLVVDDVDESSPEDISYVYSGYAPISVRLVQHALGLGSTSGASAAGAFVAGMAGVGSSSGSQVRDKTGATVTGWRGIDEVLRTLPGVVFEEQQKIQDGPSAEKQSLSPYSRSNTDQIPVTVVCFVGGCTYTELAALRFTSQRMLGRKLIVVTTGMLNGNTLMEALGPPKAE